MNKRHLKKRDNKKEKRKKKVFLNFLILNTLHDCTCTCISLSDLRSHSLLLKFHWIRHQSRIPNTAF